MSNRIIGNRSPENPNGLFARLGSLSFKKLVTIERLLTVLTVMFLLAGWYIITQLKVFSEIIVPSPGSVYNSLKDILVNGYKGNSLLRHILDSMFRLITAFGLTILTAIPLGLVSGYNSKIRAIFDPLIEFYRPLPPLAYYTLLVIWMGIGNLSKIALLYLAAFAPVYISCMAGVKNIRTDYINGAYTLGASKKQVFWHVIFPACLPQIFTGLRTSMGVAYTTLVAAEMVAAVTGIGWMVLDASRFLRSEIIFLGIFIMGITGVFLDRVIRFSESRIVPWEGKE
jgi:ABC-type nitrate/sulfonate/bicarbonate transport system, permease component